MGRACLWLAVLCGAVASSGSSAPGQGKIKHVIILMEENRSFDHVFGWLNRIRGGMQKINGLTGNETNVVQHKDGKRVTVTVDDKSPQIRYPICDPDHGTPGTTYKIFGSSAGTGNGTMGGFAQLEYNEGKENSDYCGVLSMFTPDKVPIITQLAQEFALFDEFYCSHPGPTWPNRQYGLAATSGGSTSTGAWYKGKTGTLFPQKTIMDQVAAANLTWRNYYNDTPWEMFMETIAHHPENTLSLDNFFRDAAEGTLPNYAWINPRSGINVTSGIGSNDQHPDHDMAAGEALYKDIYEALRASPQWNETLFVITYDEHGGYYDHMVPPSAPPPESHEESYPDKNFKFDRLGVRIPTLLISPWVKKGVVVPPPDKAAYDLTTLVATTRKLLQMDDEALTARDAWVATFEHMLEGLSQPRTDCPLHLVDPVPPVPPSMRPVQEADLELNSLQKHIGAAHSHAAGKHSYDDYNDFGAREGISRQGDVSEHLQRLHAEHRESMMQRKRAHAAELAATAAEYEVIVSPYGGIVSEFVITGTLGQAGSFSQVQAFKDISGTKFCLDVGADPVKVTEGQAVGVSACSDDLPAARSQRWFANTDATIRPFYAQGFCLTNTCPQGACGAKNYPAVLKRCAPGTALEVSQHWAYHGPAPGDNPNRVICFGDVQNLLAIVRA
eukprot:TRINITY_DN1943_c0_g1_i3.p1 TRINITY_DN1943_c0_g1~~TRINITY_DN1943_c0_g1_i3.p1  ORF type:complete len:690 (+),score=278.92 TRINITY_DN1943_c0_g1_i3:63-2072(+)